MFLLQKNFKEPLCRDRRLETMKMHGVQALACGFKLRPDQENKLKLELHALFPRREETNEIHLTFLSDT